MRESEKAKKEKVKTLQKTNEASELLEEKKIGDLPDEKKIGDPPEEKKIGDISIVSDKTTETETHKNLSKNIEPPPVHTRIKGMHPTQQKKEDGTMPTTQQKKEDGTMPTNPTDKKTKSKKASHKRKKKDPAVQIDEFITQIEDIATGGKNAEKLIKMVPTVIEDVIKMAGKEPLKFLIFYSKLLKVVGENIPGLLSNLQKINDDISPEVTYIVVEDGLKKALFSLPQFALSSISHPLKTVDMVISAALRTVIFLIGSIQGVIQGMMEEETKKAMSSIGRSRRGYM